MALWDINFGFRLVPRIISKWQSDDNEGFDEKAKYGGSLARIIGTFSTWMERNARPELTSESLRLAAKRSRLLFIRPGELPPIFDSPAFANYSSERLAIRFGKRFRFGFYMTRPASEIIAPRPSLFVMLTSIVVLAVPMTTLIALALRFGPTPLLAGGVATLAFLALGLIHLVGLARCSSHKNVSPVYLIAVMIVWMSDRHAQDQFQKTAMFILVGMPLTLFFVQEFLFPEGSSLRRARSLVRRLAAKNDWPRELAACKTLPEVKALREALRDDAEPVLVLLTHPKPQVRIAALAALEFRPSWLMGQDQAVLQAAKFASEPPVRAAALMALANVDDSILLCTIAEFMRDPNGEVRKAAAEAILWDVEHRWTAVRREFRDAFGDARWKADGALPVTTSLPNQALIDLTIWSGEKGPIGLRSTLTILAHYRREIQQNPGQAVLDELISRIGDNKVPSSLRVEYARLLAEQDEVNVPFWRKFLDASQPSYLRLLAAGALLRNEKNDEALQTLRDVARVPNREIAVQVAAIVQKSLRIDMGLPLGGELPEPQSKLAAEVARRVLDWASGVYKPLAEERSSRRTRLSTIAKQMPHSSGVHPHRIN